MTTRTIVTPGIEIERRWLPLDRVGCYVPGGSAPYPSSLVMTVVPARVAGVASIVVASPAAPDGTVDPVLLGAAGLLEVDALFVAGGAQAIGALAFGWTADGADPAFAPVDRIVGPGNAWVTAAKLEVAGIVGIDLPAGPSEGMVLADDDADPRTVAADLVTQAEHGPDSPAILVTTSAALADAVEREIARASPAPRPARDPGPGPRGPRPDRARARIWRRRSPSSTTTRRSTSRSTAGMPTASPAGSATRARSSSAAGRRNPPATTRPAPTMSCRPAGSPAPATRSASRRSADTRRSSGSTSAASRRSARRSAGSRRRRGSRPTGTPSRSASRPRTERSRQPR